jgi:hypothetical protein
MATYNKFNTFTEYLCAGDFNFSTTGGDTINVGLSNTTPLATNSVWANITEITAHNGYSAGGASTTLTLSTGSGTAKLVGTNVVFTASGGTIGPFEYVVLYQATAVNTVPSTVPAVPTKPLIAWWDYGSAITLNSGETFTVSFDGTNGIFQIT